MKRITKTRRKIKKKVAKRKQTTIVSKVKKAILK